MSGVLPITGSLRCDVTGVVLAGGKSSRMGIDKAFMQVHGTPLVQHVTRTLQWVFETVVIIANNPGPLEYLGVPVYPDILPGCGPMGGIHAAFHQTGADRLFVSACDLPNISRYAVHHLVQESAGYDAAVAGLGGWVHPLFGIYGAALLPEIEERLKIGEYRLKDLLAASRARTVPFGPQLPFYRDNLFANINVPADVPED